MIFSIQIEGFFPPLVFSFFFFFFFFPLPCQGMGKRRDIGTSATDSHGCVWQWLCSFLAGPSPHLQPRGLGYWVSWEFPSQPWGPELPRGLQECKVHLFARKQQRRGKGPSRSFGTGRLLTRLKCFKREKGKKKKREKRNKSHNNPELAAPCVLVEMLQTWLLLTSAT